MDTAAPLIHASILPNFSRVYIASILGKVGAPYTTAYTASKFAVAGFSESLRMELQDLPGVHVCSVFPTTIDTPLFQHAANYSGREVKAPPPIYSPNDAVNAIISCLEKPQREITVGNAGRMIAMRTIAPALAERMVAKKFDRQHFTEHPSDASPGNIFSPMPDINAVHGGWMVRNGEAANSCVESRRDGRYCGASNGCRRLVCRAPKPLQIHIGFTRNLRKGTQSFSKTAVQVAASLLARTLPVSPGVERLDYLVIRSKLE